MEANTFGFKNWQKHISHLDCHDYTCIRKQEVTSKQPSNANIYSLLQDGHHDFALKSNSAFWMQCLVSVDRTLSHN